LSKLVNLTKKREKITGRNDKILSAGSGGWEKEKKRWGGHNEQNNQKKRKELVLGPKKTANRGGRSNLEINKKKRGRERRRWSQ